jgi:TRAP-type C4-dicarboxylate transport system substrate-binding protein
LSVNCGQSVKKLLRRRFAMAAATIVALSPAEHDKFVKAVQPLYEKYGANVKDLIKQIQDVK